MRAETQITCRVEEIRGAVSFVRGFLEKRKVKSADITRSELTVEETLRACILHAAGPEEKIQIRLDSYQGNARIRLICRGTAFERADVENSLYFPDDADTNAVIEKMITRIFGNSLTIRHRNGFNYCSIQVAASRYRQLSFTVGGLLLGLLLGILMKRFLPDAVNTAVSDNIFDSVSTMFLNALKLIVGPLVFLSIATSIADFRDLRALGRIAGKLIGSYFATSVIAILLGMTVWFLLPIGNPALQKIVSVTASASTVSAAQGVTVSLKDTIVNFIPSDIIQPFLKADMMQIIFVAVFLGIASGMLTEKLQIFKSFLSDCYMIFSKMTAIIIGFMPAAVFCSMAKMALSMDLGNMTSVLTWIPVVYLADFLMLGIYGLLILLIGRQNPLIFYRKYFPVMLTGFSFASSNATLPTALETCTKRLGVARRICSFSLPLGATINMDGSCIAMVITSLFMAKIFNLPVTGQMLFTLFVSVFILSIGAPGVPGGALVCISILLPQIGIPAEAISIIIGLYSLIGMMLVCVNVMGDAAVTLLVAKSEKMLDRTVYRSKN